MKLVRVIVAVSAWAMFAGAAQADGNAPVRAFKGHADGVGAVAFSPDGRQVISGSWDKTLRLWDAASGRTLRVFKGHSDSVNAVAFSSDGRQVVSGSTDKTLRLWDVASGAMLRSFKGHSSSVLAVAFSPDGRQVISGSYDKTLRLWDVDSGRMLRSFAGHGSAVLAVAFSPDGRQAVSGSEDESLRLWDVASGRTIHVLKGHSNSVDAVAFSPDGRQVVSGSGSTDATVRLWDVASGQTVRVFRGHSDAVGAVAFSPDGRRIASGSHDKTLRLWDAASGRMLRSFSDPVLAVAFSPDGRQVVSAGYDKILRLWDVGSVQPVASGTPTEDAREAERARVERQAGPVIRVPLPSAEEVMRVVPGGGAADGARPPVQVPLPSPEEVMRVIDGSGGVARTPPAPDEPQARAEAQRQRDREEAIRREVEAKLRAEFEAKMRAEQEARTKAPNTSRKPQPASERRLALVIGIDAYESVPRLQKAVNDARAMSAALKDLGFDVILGENLDRRGINRKLLELESRITAGDVVFFFFAGHGFEIRNQNYLLPADVPQALEGQENLITAEAFAADQVLDRIRSRGARTLVAVLDACRNNPFEQPGIGRALPGSRGLARIDPPNGVFVVFSAGAKQEAIDRLGDADPDPNSVFTRVFLRHLKTPGLSIDQVVKRTRVAVHDLARTVGREQTPAFYDQVIEDLVLVPGP